MTSSGSLSSFGTNPARSLALLLLALLALLAVAAGPGLLRTSPAVSGHTGLPLADVGWDASHSSASRA